MRIAADQYVNGASLLVEAKAAATTRRLCVELRAADGSAWVHMAPGDAEVPAEGQLIVKEGARPVKVRLTANPSGFWPTVPLAKGAQVSARPGYPRLIVG